MKTERNIAFAAAVFFHGAMLCFGGLLFFHKPAEENRPIEDVALIDEAKQEEEKPKVEEAIKTEPEPMPEMPDAQTPPPEPLSLGELEVALNPGGGDGGEFGSSFRFPTGRTGGPGNGPGDLDAIFTMAELDQKPRAIFQSSPVYPVEMRQRRMEGSVYVLFIVDQQGKVTNPKIEKSSHGAFEKPALEAVRQWKFEPAVRNGQKVRCKMRVPIRFSPS